MELSRRKFLMVSGLSALGGLFAASLPGQVLAHGGEESEYDLELAMGDLYFQAEGGEKNAPITLPSGERLMVRVYNEGQVPHEVHFGRDPDLEGRLYRDDLLGSEGAHAAHGFMAVILDPGESSTLMFQIPTDKKGEWEVGCFMLGHYEAGQHAPLIVT